MIKQLDLESIDIFLKLCKKEISKGNCYFIGYRKLMIGGKYISAKQALIDIGIMNTKEIWMHICSLNKYDCIKIDRDYDMLRDRNSEIFVFKKYINNILAYIKLTINERGVICISFHKSL